MAFLGRKRELKELEKLYNSDHYEGILVYGRRRIGKSELIKESFKYFDGIAIYYECLKVTEETNVRYMCELIASKFNIPTPNFTTLKEVLEFLFDYSINNKIIFVIDEYPYIRNNSDYLDSVVQYAIDKYRMNCQMKLILCGSYVDVMENIVEATMPLYGRFTMKYNIKQMDYLEASLFYPNVSNSDKVMYYSIFGGVPYYNQFIDQNKSVKENIIDLIASPNARLLVEAESFLSLEMSKITNANECFNAIAKGNRKFSDIYNKSGVSSSPALSDTLNKLIKMDVIEKIYPINDESEKKSYYDITERLSNFYYKYIFPKNSFFRVMPPTAFYEEFIEEDLITKHVPKEFENISRQYLHILNFDGKLNPTLYKIGRYYYDDPKNRVNGEFDVVTLSKNGYDFYEVKYMNKPIDDQIVNSELEQLKKLNLKYNKLGFISKSGFNITNNNDYILITLDDIYNYSQ